MQHRPIRWTRSYSSPTPIYCSVCMPKFFYSMIVVGAGYASRYVAYAATVKLEVRLLPNAGLEGGAEVLHLGNLFKFSLTSSVKDMWQAHVYVLAVLVALCSGVWPYTKLILKKVLKL